MFKGNLKGDKTSARNSGMGLSRGGACLALLASQVKCLVQAGLINSCHILCLDHMQTEENTAWFSWSCPT